MAAGYFIFGAGYSGLAIAAELRRLYGADAVICGTSRSANRLPLLQAAGIAPFLFDGAEFGGAEAEIKAAKRALSEAEYCIISIPPQKAAETEAETAPPLKTVREILMCGSAKLKSLAYLSSIGVYGDAGGAWLDENSPLRATLPQNIARRRAEAAWTELCRENTLQCLILRLGGIYGGDLAPAGFARNSDRAKSLSRNPFARLAAGTEPPEPEPFETAEISPALRDFYLDNRRISNAKLLASGYQLRYPDYKAGLAAIWRGFTEK